MQSETSVIMLDINMIIPNKYQPRKVFDDNALVSLSESIKNYGIINPILVRKKDNKYEIIAGERRFRAAKNIGLTEVPVIIKDANEQEMAELALIENLERQGLNPIEEAKSYEEIMRIGNQTQDSLAKKLGKSQSLIANKIRLLSLPTEIQDALSNKKISERHARSLLNVETKEKQLEILNRIISEKLTVKETEQIIKEKDINEEEIKQAISDIMKSLNIKEDNDEEKEEKEDDNMNNGNFFPNFDNNNIAHNNASLNMMNMQSMNQTPMAPVQETVMPTGPVDMQPQMYNPDTFAMNNQQPMMEQSNNMNINPMDNFMNVQDSFTAPIQPMMETTISEPQQIVPEQPQVVDAPLFNPEVIMPTGPVDMQSQMYNQEPPMMYPNQFEVPVMNMNEVPSAPIVAEVPTLNKLTELQNLLTNNGYNYKVYSNETDNCVIIELTKN